MQLKIKSLRSLVVSILGAAALTVSFSGCSGEPPKPFHMQLNKQADNITKGEKAILLDNTVKNLYSYKPFANDHSAKIDVRNSTVTRTYQYNGKTASVYQYVFNLDNDGKTVKMIDNSYRYMKKPYLIGNSFIDYINQFQIDLKKYYTASLLDYSRYKTLFLAYEKEFKANVKNTPVVFNDPTDILNKKALKNIASDTVNINIQTLTPMRAYQDRIETNEFYKAFKVFKNAKEEYGRYKIVFSDNHSKESYAQLPEKFKFQITSVLYNFLPKKFNAKDKNIEVTINNDPEALKGIIKSITITNKTLSFVKINTISMYYGKDVGNNIADNIQIAPKSSVTLRPVKDFPIEKFMKITKGNQRANYGVSLSYNMADNAKSVNLYSVKHYTRLPMDEVK